VTSPPTDLAARILTRDPRFGTVGYLSRVAGKPKMTADELLAKLHTPTKQGPGSGTRPQNKRV
jgi:hypothetical protein